MKDARRPGLDCCASWEEAIRAMRMRETHIPEPWAELFGPLVRGTVDDLIVVAQIGQSLDGRIATPTGHSHYINSDSGLDHLHRLRAVADAVIVGVETVCADDPRLTVRRVAGSSPVRVIIDPNGRLPPTARVLAADGVHRIVIRARGTCAPVPPGLELIELDAEGRTLPPPAILRALAARGLKRVLVEGGASTISRFLAARCLDRLHIVVAPIILGSGAPGITLPPVERVEQAVRPRTRVHMLDGEVLFDCDLSHQRIVVGRAKKSM